MKITIEKEVKTMQEAYEFFGNLLPKTKVFVENPQTAAKIVSRYAPEKPAKPPVRNFDANREILKYVRDAGRKGRTTEDMARDLANLGVGKNRFYFAQKAYSLLADRRLARFTGENGQYIYLMPYFRKGGMMGGRPSPKPKPKPAPKPVRKTVKYSQGGNSGYIEIQDAVHLVLEDRKEKGALYPEMMDLVSKDMLKQYSHNYASAVISRMKGFGKIVVSKERVPGNSGIKYRYYLPEYAPKAQ